MNLRSISLIIPAYKESTPLSSLITSIKNDDVEIIVSIPNGDTISRKTAEECGATVVEGKQGRGSQLSNGAKVAKGDVLVFCHADTRLPDNWHITVEETLALPSVVAGAFSLSFDSNSRLLLLVSLLANWRANNLGLIYGDQTIFITAKKYNEIGGFKPLPIMEDVEFIKRLKKDGLVKVCSDKVKTSSRRYQKGGVVYSVTRNFILLSLYFIGVSPERLKNWYQ